MRGVIVFSFVSLLAVLLLQSVSAFEGGSGTSGDPYQIATCEQLQNISSDLSAHYELVQSVDCSATNPDVGGSIWGAEGFVPINGSFSGTLDGNKRAIRDLYINRSVPNQGLFAGSSSSAVVSNLRLENSFVRGTSNVGSVGGAGFSGSIYNVSVRGVVIGTGSRVGGLVGQLSDADVDQVSFIGNVTGGSGSTHEVGGIVGRTSGNTEVGTAYAQGSVTGVGCIGGLIGDSSTLPSSFSEMYSAAEVSGSGQGVGAIVGCVRATGDSFTNMYWDDEISSVSWQGSTHTANPNNVNNVIGFNTSDMIGIAAENNFTGFDFVDVWRSITIPDDDYPVFFWQAGDLEIVTGFVEDSFSGSPVVGANITAVPDDSSFGTVIAITNATGWYNITLPSTPEYTFTVRGNVTDNSDGFNFIGGDQKIVNVVPDLEVNFSLGPFFEGAGTTQDPFRIYTIHDLQSMRYNLSQSFQLMNDIDASETIGWFSGFGFEPIGNDSNRFTGSLDGNGNTISNLFISRSSESEVGLFGFIQNSNINNLFLYVNVVGDYLIGGLVGRSFTSNISNIKIYSDVFAYSSSSGASDAGGLIGDMRGGNLANISVVSNVSASGRDIGGVIGYIGSTMNSITRVSGIVNVTQRHPTEGEIGGLLGGISESGSNTLINNTYIRGTIIGTGNSASYPGIGGLVGGIRNTNNHIIHNSYSTALVTQTGTGPIGGLIGNNAYIGGTNIHNSFWDNETSEQSTSAGGTGLLTINMTNQSTFTDAGWDFDNTWEMVLKQNEDYPVLQFQALQPIYFDEGTGTFEDLFQINNCIELQYMNTDVTAHYILVDNIDCSETVEWNSEQGFEPVGNSSVLFSGSLNGQNFTIQNLFINRTTGEIGLFGRFSGNISNLVLDNVGIKGTSAVGSFVGSMRGGTLFNVHSSGNVTSNGDDAGGIAGASRDNPSFIIQSSSTVNVVSHAISGGSVGGLVAYGQFLSISESFSKGSVRDANSTHQIGGLVGYLATGNITDSYSKSLIIGGFENAAALVGIASVDSFINNSYSVGLVNSSANNVGGLVAFGSPNVFSSYWDIQTSNQTNSSGGEGKTTAQMRQISTFTNWNFSSVWSDVCDGWHYPTLQWQNLYSSASQCPNYVAQDSSSTTQSSSSSDTTYYPRTIILDAFDFSQGYKEGLRLNERYQFNATHSSNNQNFIHTLRLNRFNATHADVTIQSDPIRIVIAKDINEYVDIDGDGQADILVRYEGIENGRAVIFVQQLFVDELVETEVSEEPVIQPLEEIETQEEIETRSPWPLVILIFIIAIITSYVYQERKKIE